MDFCGLVIVVMMFISTVFVRATSSRQTPCGQDEFRESQSGACRKCNYCGPGFTATKDCGDGFGSWSECASCPAGEYQDWNSWNILYCQPWTDCKDYNRKLIFNGTAQRNAQCGTCIDNYNADSYSNAIGSGTYYPCSPDAPASSERTFTTMRLPADLPITGASSGNSWTVVVPVAIIAVFTLVGGVCIVITIYRNRRQKAYTDSQPSHEVQFFIEYNSHQIQPIPDDSNILEIDPIHGQSDNMMNNSAGLHGGHYTDGMNPVQMNVDRAVQHE